MVDGSGGERRGAAVPKRARGAQRGNRNAQVHGVYSLGRRLKNAGLAKVDGRSALERLKSTWKTEIRCARGGELSPQHEVLLEVASNTWLMLSSADDFPRMPGIEIGKNLRAKRDDVRAAERLRMPDPKRSLIVDNGTLPNGMHRMPGIRIGGS